MTVTTEGLANIQEKIIRENFERSGPFFLSRDLHPMLDCACAPEFATYKAAGNDIDAGLDVPLSVPFNAKLREEFFGGILFDRDQHRHFMVDHTAYGILREAAQGRRTGRELLDFADHTNDASEVRQTLGSLLQNNLLGPRDTDTDTSVEHFAARDLSLNYLQSPIIVEVEVTYGCFRACRHCAYESSPEARIPGELTAPQWGAIFGKLAEAGVLIVQLTGGDPLFRDDSFDIVEAADAAGLSVYIRSDTAALNMQSVERLKALRGLWHVGTSIDGADAQTHDWMRGRGAFDMLRERVGILAAAGIPVAAGATLHKNNHTTVREIGRRITEFGAKWFDIGFLSPVGRGVNLRDLVLDDGEIRASLDLYLQGVRSGDYTPSHSHYVRRGQANQPFADLTDLVDKLPYLTEWPFSRMRLDPTGSSYTAGKLKGSDFSGGYNLQDNALAHIWDNSPNLAQLRELGGGGRIHSLDYRLLRSSHEFM
ncbi:radical SAM protein [Streptomyces sp. SID13666]|uniref:radical SAM protein n=1 Tax=unclassified Streptomyces TaxID=2593676 RepID=UPI0013BF74B8|nr:MULTISPECIES: radical SAM protein [unclassified Streptomyces]NEA56631.1 radical SAM protein [Streptomyces sp. SID13666]NEA73075.1 radical SAM protein [Streptomyces sp. SID13588]